MNDAKEFLKRYRKLQTKITNKLIEKSQWHDLSLSITASMGGARVMATGNQSKMANAVERCVDIEAEIANEISKLGEEAKTVTAALERLENHVEYDLLHMLYIQNKTLQDVASKYEKDYGWATTTHGRAIKNLNRIIKK